MQQMEDKVDQANQEGPSSSPQRPNQASPNRPVPAVFDSMRNKRCKLIESELEQVRSRIQETRTNGKALEQDERSKEQPLLLAGMERQLKVAEAFLSESCSKRF